jgi:hypothetical protein
MNGFIAGIIQGQAKQSKTLDDAREKLSVFCESFLDSNQLFSKKAGESLKRSLRKAQKKLDGLFARCRSKGCVGKG